VTERATLLFGLSGVRVVGVKQEADGARVLAMATDEEAAAAGPSCWVFSTSVQERVATRAKVIR
jgi:transposase